jgi:Mn2+/Fe2+ NRAMP family transporter
LKAFGTVGRVLPGIIAGAADLDPAAVMTAVVVGASFGYSIGWVVIACVPVLWSVFSVSARLGLKSRRGLVEIIRTRRSKRAAVLMALGMVSVNLAMIVADLRAVSDAFSVVLHQSPIFFLVPVAFSVWWVLIRGGFQRITRVLGVLALAQLAYVAAAVLATHSLRGLLRGIFVPHASLTSAYAVGVIALFGSLLTPDVIVWQTSSQRDSNKATAAGGDSHAGTFVAALVSLSAVVCASALHVAHPADMNTREAALALAPLGTLGPVFFSLGIIGSGLVALPILVASMCYSIAEAVDWKSGLSQNPWEARFFYVLLSGAVFIGVLSNFAPLNTVKILYWSQVMAGILVMPILWNILRLTNDRSVVGERNSFFQNFWLGGAIAGSLVANLMLVWSFLH